MSAEREQALATLLARQGDFRAFLARRLGDDVLAEDVLARSLDRLEGVNDPVAWFYRALRNAVTDTHRRQGAHQRKLDAFAAEIDGGPSEETEQQVCRCVLGLVETLKPAHAEVLRRTAVDEVAVRDYAAEIGIGRNAAAVRAHRAREALRKEVHATCGACAGAGCADCTCGD